MRLDSKEAEFSSDENDIIFVMLMICSSIVTSRKRKLHELWVVATHADTLPHDAFENTEAPTSTPAEWQFLQANDVLQYVRTIDLDGFYTFK